jgi:hypothetical protein
MEEVAMQRIMKVGMALAALTGIAAGLGTAAMAQEDCSWYALTSAKQQQENDAKACGLSGEGWTTDIQVHTAWCESVPPDQWRKAVADRQKQLDGCGG